MKVFYALISALVIVAVFYHEEVSAFQPIAIPGESETALVYHDVSNAFWMADQVLSLLFPLLILWIKLGKKIPSRIYRSPFLFALAYFAIDQLVRLPLQYLWTAAHAEAAGKVGLGLTNFLSGKIPGLLLITFGLACTAAMFYSILSKFPKRWWIWTSLLLSALVLAVFVFEPFSISLKPIGTTAIENKIVALAGRAGVPRNGIVIEHCEPARTCPPGRVVGLGPTRRLILDGALLERNSESKLLQVVAHEAKHFAKDDNALGFIIIAGLCFLGLASTELLAKKIHTLWSYRLDIESIYSPASLPLFCFLLTGFYLAVLPGISLFRQHVEREADRFGLELNRDNNAAAMLMVDDLKNMPLAVIEWSLFFRLTRATHPSIGERIRFANSYHPWLEGKPLVYADEFIQDESNLHPQ